MTPEEIIRRAREAGFVHVRNHGIYLSAPEQLERFVALVTAHSVADYKMLQEIEYVGKLYPDGLTNQIEAAVLAERDRMCKQFNIPMELANETATSNETD